MASIIKIKRSGVTAIPASLEEGEVAYSELSKQFFIGTNGGADIEVLGGKRFTDMLDHTPGTLTASSALLVDASSKIDHIIIDNIDIDGNTISTTNANGDLVLAPNGTGAVDAKALKLNAGSVVVTAITDADDLDGGSSSALATSRAVKAYVDAMAQGLHVKQAVRAATAGVDVDLELAADPNPIDGVTLNNGDRVLLKDQTNQTENGIYVAVDAEDPTTWVRSADFDEPGEIVAGTFMFVEEGTVNADAGFVTISDNPIVVGTDPIEFTQFSGAGAVTAGDGLDKTGNTLSVLASDLVGNGITATSNNFNVNVDDDTIEVNGGNAVAVKADGIDATHILLDSVTNIRAKSVDGLFEVDLIGTDGDDFVFLPNGARAGSYIDMNTYAINNLAAPTADQDAATKKYVDDAITGGGLVADDITLEVDSGVIFVKTDGLNGTHLRLENEQPLRARNAAGDGDVGLITLNADDEVVVTGLTAPTGASDAATKQYVDDNTVGVDDVTIQLVSDILSVKTDGLNGTHVALENNQALRSANAAASGFVETIKVDASDDVVLPNGAKAGAAIDMATNLINNLADPLAAQDAATKKYVDDAIAGAAAPDVDDVTIEVNGLDQLAVKADGINGTHIRLDNTQTLRGRNAADDADVDMLSVDANDQVFAPNGMIMGDHVNMNSNRLNNVASIRILNDEGVRFDTTTGNVYGMLIDTSDVLHVAYEAPTQVVHINGVVSFLSGDAIDFGTSVLQNLAAPTADQDAATKKYVDDADAAIVDMIDAAVATIPASLDDLNDVTLTAPANGNMLVFNGGQFINVTLSGDASIDATGALTIANSAVTNGKLANSTVTFAGDTGSDTVALGETATFNGTNGIAVAVASNTITVDLEEVDGGSF